MDSDQLLKLIQKDVQTSSIFGGVLPADAIPFHVAIRPRLYFVNTEDHHRRGKHWVVFFFPSTGHAEMFDSFANSPARYGEKFVNFLSTNSISPFQYTRKRLQEDRSTKCGAFCLLFAVTRSHGMNLRMVEDLFTDNNYLQNDRDVQHFVNTL
jgi:hypothetical protein